MYALGTERGQDSAAQKSRCKFSVFILTTIQTIDVFFFKDEINVPLTSNFSRALNTHLVLQLQDGDFEEGCDLGQQLDVKVGHVHDACHGRDEAGAALPDPVVLQALID